MKTRIWSEDIMRISYTGWWSSNSYFERKIYRKRSISSFLKDKGWLFIIDHHWESFFDFIDLLKIFFVWHVSRNLIIFEWICNSRFSDHRNISSDFADVASVRDSVETNHELFTSMIKKIQRLDECFHMSSSYTWYFSSEFIYMKYLFVYDICCFFLPPLNRYILSAI